MRSLVPVMLLVVFGLFAGTLWTFVVVIAGVPGARLQKAGRRSNRSLFAAIGSGLCVLGQAYAALAFTAGIVLYTHNTIASGSLSGWVLWAAAFVVAGVPAWSVSRDAAPRKEMVVGAEMIGFFVFLIAPEFITWGWPWVRFVTSW